MNYVNAVPKFYEKIDKCSFLLNKQSIIMYTKIPYTMYMYTKYQEHVYKNTKYMYTKIPCTCTQKYQVHVYKKYQVHVYQVYVHVYKIPSTCIQNTKTA
jgi:hypothetical protein